MGSASNPTTLTGNIMDQDVFTRQNMNSKNLRAVQNVYIHRLQLYYIFNETEECLRLNRYIFPNIEEGPSPQLLIRLAFQALSHFARSHETGRQRYARKGRSFLGCLERMLAKDIRTLSPASLLQKPKTFHSSVAVERTPVPIEGPTMRPFRRRDALEFFMYKPWPMSEQVSFFAARKETSWATTNLTRAFLLYTEWGRHAKASQMVS